MDTVTIPKNIARQGELVVIPRKELDALVARASEAAVTQKDIMRWSREARTMKRMGKLPALRSLREV